MSYLYSPAKLSPRIYMPSVNNFQRYLDDG